MSHTTDRPASQGLFSSCHAATTCLSWAGSPSPTKRASTSACTTTSQSAQCTSAAVTSCRAQGCRDRRGRASPRRLAARPPAQCPPRNRARHTDRTQLRSRRIGRHTFLGLTEVVERVESQLSPQRASTGSFPSSPSGSSAVSRGSSLTMAQTILLGLRRPRCFQTQMRPSPELGIGMADRCRARARPFGPTSLSNERVDRGSADSHIVGDEPGTRDAW